MINDIDVIGKVVCTDKFNNCHLRDVSVKIG